MMRDGACRGVPKSEVERGVEMACLLLAVEQSFIRPAARLIRPPSFIRPAARLIRPPSFFNSILRKRNHQKAVQQGKQRRQISFPPSNVGKAPA